MKRPKLTHVDERGQVAMVDVSAKEETERSATARALLKCAPATRDAIASGDLENGEALAAARVAAVLAAKKTGDLIPLCHPIALTDVRVEFVAVSDGIAIEVTAFSPGGSAIATARRLHPKRRL